MNPRYSAFLFFEPRMMTISSAGTTTIPAETTQAMCAAMTESIPSTPWPCTETISLGTPAVFNPFTPSNTVLLPADETLTFTTTTTTTTSTPIINSPFPATFTRTTGVPMRTVGPGSTNSVVPPTTSGSPDIGAENTNPLLISRLLVTSTPIIPTPFTSTEISTEAMESTPALSISSFSAAHVTSTSLGTTSISNTNGALTLGLNSSIIVWLIVLAGTVLPMIL